MKKKTTILAILFFIIVNLSFLWQQFAGTWSFGIFLVLVFCYIIISFVLLLKIGGLIIDKFKNTSNNISVVIVFSILVIIYLYPGGLVESFYPGRDSKMIATREGAANCMTSIILFENNKFEERIVCFGIEKHNGTYEFINDTVKLSFDNKSSYDSKDAFGIIELNSDTSAKYLGNFQYYRNLKDTFPLQMTIVHFEKDNL